MRFTVIGDTRRNHHYADKPNEDFYWFDEAQGAALLEKAMTFRRPGGWMDDRTAIVIEAE